jgi:ACS family glucarate transporter-like MFS transporter
LQDANPTRPQSIARLRVRWRIFSMLVAFAAIAYFQQRSLTVASERIMPELSLSQMQVGWLQWAFVASYALMQFPGGVLGQRFGARRALTVIIGLAVFATAVVPLAPAVLSGTALFAALLATQFLLGIAHGPFMPVCAGTMEAWLPANRWALAQGIHTLGGQVGAAIAPPLLVVLMQSFGWQRALFWAALPPLLLVPLWAWYGRNTPREHPSVSQQELAELDEASIPPTDTSISAARVKRILVNRDVFLVTMSYICMNYVYYLLANWSFFYLLQQRHFTALEGGWLAALPPIGAAVGAGSGGALTDVLCRRFGVRWGYRLVPMVSLPCAGMLLLYAIYSTNPYVAVAALTTAFAAVEITEGAYWAGTMRIAQADSMAATGVLNTGGNFGGLIGIPIVAYLSGHGAWNTAFVVGFVCALGAALLWLGIDPSRPLVPHGASDPAEGTRMA